MHIPLQAFHIATDRREMQRLYSIMTRLAADECGEDLIEYGILAGLITLAVVSAIQGIGCKVNIYYSNANTTLP